MKIKTAPDISGYYWVKRNGVWDIVKVEGQWACGIGIDAFIRSQYVEWIGPLFPSTVSLYITVEAE